MVGGGGPGGRARTPVGLARHLQSIEDEKGRRAAALAAKIDTAASERKKLLDDIDARLAQLQKQREQVIVETTNIVNELQQKQKELAAEAEEARKSITLVVNAFSQLITFFTGGRDAGGAK